MNPKVYIVLVSYNGWQDTIECLESTIKSDYDNYQIIVVDNNSPDCSMDYIRAWAEGEINVWYPDKNSLKHLSYPPKEKPLDYVLYTKNEALCGGCDELERDKKNPIIFIQSGENKGFAAGNNIAFNYARQKSDLRYIWMLNNDTVIEKNSLTELVKKITTENKLAAVGSKILYYQNPTLLQNIGSKVEEKSFFKLCKPILDLNIENIDKGQYDYDYEVNDIMGASLLIKKEIIEQVGLMPEEYFLYGEETDWNFRIQQHGFRLLTTYKSKVYHKKSVSTGGDRSPTTLYYRTRAQFILNKKFMTTHLFLLFCIAYITKKLLWALTLPKKENKIVIKALIDGVLQKRGVRKL